MVPIGRNGGCCVLLAYGVTRAPQPFGTLKIAVGAAIGVRYQDLGGVGTTHYRRSYDQTRLLGS